MQLLKTLCSIHAPSGDETRMTEFLLDYINKEKSKWKSEPVIYSGDGFQNCILLIFGKPTTAVYAHIDSIGFTIRYNNELVKIGGPVVKKGFQLTGSDSKGTIDCLLSVAGRDKKLKAVFKRTIDRGTSLTFKPKFRETKDSVQCCYLDNRLGVWNALRLAETLKHGAIAFTCWEEHGGGSAGYLGKFLLEKYGVRQSLISDITWVTEGVKAGKGVAISLRDSGIPRRSYTNRIVSIAEKNNIPFQLEVEGSGGSDGNDLQRSPYPIDWCFVGAPEDHVHSPDEKVHKKDIASMLTLYQALMKAL